MQTHLDSLLRRIANHAAQEAPGGQKQAAVVVILADHQRGELWKRKPISGWDDSRSRVSSTEAVGRKF